MLDNIADIVKISATLLAGLIAGLLFATRLSSRVKAVEENHRRLEELVAETSKAVHELTVDTRLNNQAINQLNHTLERGIESFNNRS